MIEAWIGAYQHSAIATLSAGVERVHLGYNTSNSATNMEAFAQVAADQAGDTLPFYEIEGQILALWDQLNELKLEKALLDAQVEPGEPQGNQILTDEEFVKELELAERQCLNARTNYMLRQSVVEDTIIASPILNAIHAGSNATGTERTLQPLLNRRDVLGVVSTNLASSLSTTIKATSKMVAENLITMNKNRALVVSLINLTDRIKDRSDAVTQQPEVNTRLNDLREEAETAREQWRIMKNVVGAVIAGSGVDWAQDGTLIDLVLDPEEDEL
ncbi:MAG: hypothetical protein Q9217_001030 [Psora testacea]